jgi:hypothetical protein
MSNTTISVLVRCWYDLQTGTTRLQVIRTDTSEAVRLGDKSFLLYFSVEENTSVKRCRIRHIASGKEAFVQVGPNLLAFIRSCLLDNDGPEHNDSGY